MKYSIVYSTHTNNAVKLADAISSQLNEEDLLYKGLIKLNMDFLNDSDIVFVGFWTTANSCDARVQKVLSDLKNKKVAIFGSCAFGTKEDGHFDEVKNNVLKYLDSSNTLVGFYLTLGEIGKAFVEKALESNGKEGEDFHFPSYRKYYKNAMNHPTEEELKALQVWTKTIIENN